MDFSERLEILTGMSIDKLEDLKWLVEDVIKKKEKEEDEAFSRKMAVDRLGREYKTRTPKDAPEFNKALVCSESREDGGYEGSYDDKKGIKLNVRSHLTARLGDYDMFTDVWGSIHGVSFSKRGN